MIRRRVISLLITVFVSGASARESTETGTARNALERLDECLRQIDAHDSEILAVETLYREEAAATARVRDEETEEGESRGPLHAVPVAVKDLFALNARETRAGFSFAVYENATRQNAEPVQKLVDAGAVLVGTTRLTEGAWTEYSAAGGPPPRNPFSSLLWQGDSSSGCGTGVAAGFYPICLATDTSGSIRNPCLMNSLACVKPRRAMFGRGDVWPLAQRLDTVGVVARNAADLASAMQAADASRDFLKAAADARSAVKTMRVGIPWSLVDAAEPESLAPTIRDAAKLFRSLGVELVDVGEEIEALVPLMDALAARSTTTIADAAANNYRDVPHKDEIGGQLRELIDSHVTHEELDEIEALASNFTESWQSKTGHLDAVMLFVWGRPAPLETEIPDIVTTPALFADAVRYMVPFNYADLPLFVVPARVATCGKSECPFADRPRSFQLVGNSELALLQLTAAYEEARGELEYPYDDASDDASDAAASDAPRRLRVAVAAAGAAAAVPLLGE
mmetsp:Transcript_22215/g.68526  ORF Transcript_22215/g.68526 Transcript_22215/m.68526 type:complete len:510 (+) Transcript_22215:2153-3682(+)